MNPDELISSFAFDTKRKHEEDVDLDNKKICIEQNSCVEQDVSQVCSPNVIVFDVETSSLKGSVIQLAWVLANPSGEILQTYCEYWKLEKEDMDPRSQQIHQISEDTLRECGMDPYVEVQKFFKVYHKAIQDGCMMIAHNASFDIARINHTAKLYNINETMEKDKIFCTMRNSILRCGLVKVDNKKKMPTNSELYEKLFNELPTGCLHDALEDCKITLKSFTQARLNGWW